MLLYVVYSWYRRFQLFVLFMWYTVEKYVIFLKIQNNQRGKRTTKPLPPFMTLIVRVTTNIEYTFSYFLTHYTYK